MALSDQAARAAPYLQQLLYDREVQDAMRRAGGAARDAYARARGKSAREAVNDKKLRRRLRQAVVAGWEVWCAIGEPPRRKPRWRLKLIALAVGSAGAFVAVNAQARQKALDMLGSRGAKPADPLQ
jgi:hypothetical protein